MKQLTARQNEVLRAIARSWREGRSPSTSELLERLHLATISGLDDLLRPIERKGFIEVHRPGQGKQRTIGLTAAGRALSGIGVPILGEIPAGPLQEAIQQSGEWIGESGSLLRTQEGDFLLRVKGDSMIGAGILPLDLVLLRPQIEARSGEIVAAQICDTGFGEEGGDHVEATLKYLDRLDNGRRIRLRAANPAYPDREFEASCVRVAGVFRGLVRDSGF